MIPEGFHLPVFMNGPVSQKPIHRPWPPIYRQQPNRTSFCFRPQESPPWRDYGYREKGREYYYLAPLYRNALPPPPQPIEMPPPRRLMLLNPQTRSCPSECPCLHRSRSLEDVRSDLNSEWSDDDHKVNGYRYNRKNTPKSFPNKIRRSIDDSVKMDPRRRGSYQVGTTIPRLACGFILGAQNKMLQQFLCFC